MGLPRNEGTFTDWRPGVQAFERPSGAFQRGKLLNESATIALAKHDAGTGFVARTGRGSAAKGPQVLAKLDGAFERNAGKSGAGAGLELKTAAFALSWTPSVGQKTSVLRRCGGLNKEAAVKPPSIPDLLWRSGRIPAIPYPPNK